MNVTVFIATSLDGFIARSDGDIGWLTTDRGDPPDEDYGFGDFFSSVDALVLGRNSFDAVLGFDPWPYADKAVFVLTNRPLDVPEEIADTVEAMAGSPAEVVAHLADRSVGHMYLDGGRTVQAFFAAGLVDRLILTRIPVLIGTGIPLFGPVENDIELQHVDTRAWPSGLVQSEYLVARV